MTALSINMSTRDKETTWADVTPTIHHQSRLHILSLSLWKLVGDMADEEQPDWRNIKLLQDIAQEMDDYSDECEQILRKQYEEETAQERDHTEDMHDERPF